MFQPASRAGKGTASMDLELKDKVAVVGGASKGLGRACAEVLAEEGARVVVCSRTQADLDRTAKEIREATGTDVLALAGDLDNHQTIRDLIAGATSRFGRLDILVNNSGGPPLAGSQRHGRAVGDGAAAVPAVLRAHVAGSDAPNA